MNAATAPAVEVRSGWSTAAWLKRLASLKLTLVALILLGGGVIVYSAAEGAVWLLIGPLFLGAVNLSAALLTHPAFRRQAALLAFHLALLAIVVLVAAGRLTYLKGQLELAEGEAFSGELASSLRGPLHRSQLDRARFVNDGFTIRYEEGVRRAETRNTVRWLDETGGERRAVIGDNEPLNLHGYRFYTSFNKGFAAVFLWRPDNGTPQRGTVNFPSYPIHEYRQALDWMLPGTRTTIWTMLQFDEVLLDPGRATHFRLPERHALIIRIGAVRHELAAGASLALPEGILTYERLSTWMGYTVFYDWTLPWLLAAGLLAAASLAWHFWTKFAAQPWDQ